MTQPSRPKVPAGIEPRLRRGPSGPVWRYRVRWTDPGSGRRLVEELDTVQEALDFKAHLRLLKRRDALDDLSRGEALLRDFVAQEWWPKDAGRNLERSTLKTYQVIWNRHLEPRVGHLQLRQLTPPTIQDLREAMEADEVGVPTIRKALATLQAICRYAVSKGHLRENPVRQVAKPRQRKQLAVTAISPGQVERLRRCFLDGYASTGRTGRPFFRDPHPISALLVSLIAYEGLRPEEALALDSVRVRKATVLVDRRNIAGELVAGQKGGRRTPTRATRSPELFKPVARDLAEHRLAMDGQGLLFSRGDGSPWRETDYRNWRTRHFKPAVAHVGLPITRPYDLRHACASLLLHAGWSLPEVADHMGHTIGMLSETYAHVIADLKGQPRVPVHDAIQSARRRRAVDRRANLDA